MDLDLAIIGGGPAGIATALFLAACAPHLRDRIAVLEKGRYPRDKICAGAIGARADRLLATLGVRVDVPSVPIRGLSVATRDGALSVHDADTHAPIGRVVRRIEFDHALAAEALARGIRVHEGARVTGIDIGHDGVRIQSTVGEVRARAVVGADGVGSFVRRAIDAPKGRWIAQVVEVDTPPVEIDPSRDLLHFDLTDAALCGYAWDFPTLVGGRALVCRGLYELRCAGTRAVDTERATTSDDLGSRLLARLERLGVATAGLRLKRFAERGLSLHEPLARDRVLLVGEAAGIDPVLGEGIAQAIFYGAAAASFLARSFADRDLTFRGWPRALARSRVGLDLRLRARAAPRVYGLERAAIERWIAHSPDLARAGMRYFAGDHVPRAGLAAAAIMLVRSLAEGRIASTSWRR